MKKILLAFLIGMSCAAFARAVDMDVWISSNTATADTTLPLCGQYLVGTSTAVYHGVLHEVVVSTGASGGVTVYQSSFSSTANSIGPINTAAVAAPFVYDVAFPSGMMYTKTGTAQVQILYQCY